MTAAADAKKSEGNEFFKNKDYPNAIAKYTEAIDLDPKGHVYYSNRSAAYIGWGKYEEAAKDAEKCIELNPSFIKGYHRHGLALKGLKKYEEALKTLRAGNKIDFNNKDLNKLISEIEPLQEQVEQARRSGLSTGELLKEQGNDLFKKAQFERAIETYGEAIQACDKSETKILIACYNNRAACYQQLSNFSGTIEDCTQVLELDPKNQKALLRRGLAYEGLERYRLALQDIRTLLGINPNIDIANRAQHRLGECVRQLKKESSN